jgi:hypothetical protein
VLQGELGSHEDLCGSAVGDSVSAHGSSVLGATAATGEDLLDASLEQRRVWLATVG